MWAALRAQLTFKSAIDDEVLSNSAISDQGAAAGGAGGHAGPTLNPLHPARAGRRTGYPAHSPTAYFEFEDVRTKGIAARCNCRHRRRDELLSRQSVDEPHMSL